MALLLYTQPIWSTVFGKVVLNESFTKTKSLANVAAIAGVVTITEPWNSFGGNPLAFFIAGLSGVLLSAWVIMGRKSGLLGHNPVVTAFNTKLFALVWGIASLPVLILLIPESTITAFNLEKLPAYFILLLAYSLISGTIPDLLFYKGIASIPASVGGIILLLEPVSAIAIAAIFLNQAITTLVLLGGALILFSNFLVTRESKNSS